VKNEAFLKQLALASERSAVTTTVCTGSALIARLNGRDMAAAAARNMEYPWNEEPSNDPFA